MLLCYADRMVGVAASGDREKFRHRRVTGVLFGLMGLFFFGFSSSTWAQTPPGTIIANTASVDYVDNGGLVNTVASNQIDFVALPSRSTATVEFLRVTNVGVDNSQVGPTQCAVSGTVFTPLPDPVLFDGSQIDPLETQPVVNVDIYHTGEPFFIRLNDPDQNLDANVVDVAQITLRVPASGDTELLQLSETGINTGLFAGHIQSAPVPVSANDCILQISEENQVIVDYQDPRTPSDTASAEALVDPFGLVFNSQTGVAINGAQISLIDAGTGLVATVFGDDGTATFPSLIASGADATDSSGALYVFSQGGFRFPVVPSGNYTLVVTPPAGFVAPSTVDVIDLQLLPGAPFALSPASFGLPFTVVPGQVINVDIPLDPIQAGLFVQKTTPNAIAAVGDFVQYAVTVDNPDAMPASGVTIVDVLPMGFRYIEGSTSINGTSVIDPSVAADGRTLSFAAGDIAPNAGVRLSYVTEVTVGTRQQDATNIATAIAINGQPSNEASATVRITEDLFRSQSILMGRVIQGECQPEISKDLTGVQGVRVYLEDGRYAITDEDGRYHFEAVEPGTHVVQMDLETLPSYLEATACEDNSRFAGRPYSRFVDLHKGSLWRADFFAKEKPTPTAKLQFSLSTVLGEDSELRYTIKLDGGELPVKALQAMVMLPAGFDYVANTARLNGEHQEDPRVNGQALSFDLGDQKAPWAHELAFTVTTIDAEAGDWVTKALVKFENLQGETVKTPIADNVVNLKKGDWHWTQIKASPTFDVRKTQLRPSDKEQLKRLVSELGGVKNLSVTCTGHADSRPIALENRDEFEDNYALSYARARSVAQYLVETLGLKPNQLHVEAAGPSQPVADNDTETGRVKNRRVEMSICAQKAESVGAPELTKATSGIQEIEYQGLSVKKATEQAEASSNKEIQNTEPDYNDEAWVDKVQPGTEWLLPVEGKNPAIPSVKLAIKHDPNHVVEMQVNGKLVSSLNFDGTAINADKTVAISRWRGVDLKDGSNTLEAVIKSQSGEVLQRLGRGIHFADGPSRGVIDLEASKLVADGTTRPVVAVRLYDRWGKPARPDTLGILRVDPPYRSWWEVEALQDNTLVAVGSREPLYTVGQDGIALIELEPTSQSGEVVLHLNMPNNREQEIRAWLKPAARDWILVGIAEGTLGYNTIKDNVDNAEDAGLEDDIYEDGRVAFFAKGRIKGDFLLTMALDTARDREQAEERLLGTIDPDRFYTLYGDTTEQYFEAPSQRKFYLKLERNQFVALFGDYETGLTVTELSRYNRSFNGIKSEYYGDRVAYSAFATESSQAFVKDEIRGDGTSGLYQLSRRPIIINSEKLVLEARDRFRSEEIVWTRTLSRHIDYDIDYLQGTLFFKEPILSRDENLNPVFIVVDYESRDSSDENTIAGGRGALKFSDGRLEMGGTYIHEGTQGGDGELYGADLKWKIDEVTELKAEAAHSENIAGEGDAYLVELTRRSNQVDGRAYVREQESEFGLGQQRVAESGTRKLGVDGRLRFSEKLSLNGEIYRQRVLATAADRDVAQAELRYQNDTRAAGVGLRHAVDEDAAGAERKSEQVFVSGSALILDKKLTIRGSAELALGGSNESVDFPSRTVLGLDYHMSDKVTLFTEYEFADGSEQDSHMMRVGAKASPWDRAQFQSSVNSQLTENGVRLFSTTGLTQGWQINERWALDMGLDHTDTLRDPGGEPFNVNVPLASGSLTGDFTSMFVGALYRSDLWTSTSRMEYRTSSIEKRLGLFTGFHREAVAGKGFSASMQYFDSDQSTGLDAVNAETRLSWAYRPVQSEWILLDRLDLVYESKQDALTDVTSWRVVNNFNANWKPNRKSQIGIQYGAKFVRSNILGTSYTGYTDLIGLDYRRDLNRTWDIGLHGSTLHSWKTDVIDYSWGADVGFSFATNMWLSLGYNFDGFEDDDFSLSRYTAHGPYIRFRIKTDQDSFRKLRDNLRPDERRLNQR